MTVARAGYTAAVFDMDGLLLDSERPVRDAWMQVAAEFGAPLTLASYLDLVGRNHRDSARTLRTIFGDDAALAKAAARATALLEERFGERGFDVKPGACRLLRNLRGVGIPCAVASSTHRADVLLRLQRAGLLGHFTAICGGDEITHGKPAPDLYRLALTRLGVTPRTTIAFEDSGHGVQAALAAGLATVAVPDLKAPAPEWLARCLAVLPSLEVACEHSVAWFGAADTS